MNKSTGYYVFWKIKPGRERKERGEKKNEENEVKGNLFLMKYKHYS